MKYISICSGIEAATVAFHGFGWTPLAFSEIEPFPSAVLAARWPQVPNLGDMTKFAEWPEEILAECDLLVGGPPCQAFSVAGLRKSLDDDRGNITLAYVRLLNHIDEVRKRHGRPPAIAVYENVPGLLSTKDNAFGCLIGALAGCDEAPETETGKWPKSGYVCGETRRVGYRILDAQFFGVAQRRRRIFLVAVPCELVASLGDNACPSEILSLRESLRGNPPTRSKAGQGAASGTEGRPRGGGEPCYLDRAMFNQGVNAQYKPQITQDGVSACLNGWDERHDPPKHMVACNVYGGNCRKDRPNGGFYVETDADSTKTLDSSSGLNPAASQGGVAILTKPSNTKTCQDGSDEKHDQPKNMVAFKESQSGCRTGAVHATIDANKGSRHQEGVLSSMQVRRLTPAECEFLQGFPAGHTAITFRKKPAADGPRYRALGNSMAVPCMVWLGHRIQQATKGDNT